MKAQNFHDWMMCCGVKKGRKTFHIMFKSKNKEGKTLASFSEFSITS
jgi:hypothetical protein